MSELREAYRQLPAPLRGLRAAFAFFTRVPVGGFPYRADDWVWAAAHAPLVGLVLGAVLGQLNGVLSPLGVFPAALLTIGASLTLTGALHEDGLADTCDALGGGHDRERVLAILKDSRIGSFGGAALVLTITSRAALLAALGSFGVLALPLAWCGARVGPIWLLAALPYVTNADTAKSRDFARASLLHAVVASAWFVAAQAVLVHSGALSFLRASALTSVLASVTAISGYRYWVRVRGITGDFLGATEQCAELAALVVLAWKA